MYNIANTEKIPIISLTSESVLLFPPSFDNIFLWINQDGRSIVLQQLKETL